MTWFHPFAMAGIVLPGLVLIAGGCTRQPREAGPPAPVLRAEHDSHEPPLLQTLRQLRDNVQADVRAAQAALAEFRQQHPDLDDISDVSRQKLMQISHAYVAAQLEGIEARAKYAAGHPVALAAQKREEELSSRYQQSLAALSRGNKLLEEREQLETDLAQKQELLRRLEDRIARLEDRDA